MGGPGAKHLQAEAAGADLRLAAINGELAELDVRISLNDDRLKSSIGAGPTARTATLWNSS